MEASTWYEFPGKYMYKDLFEICLFFIGQTLKNSHVQVAVNVV